MQENHNAKSMNVDIIPGNHEGNVQQHIQIKHTGKVNHQPM